jgi:hypothetical protein
MIVAWQSNAYLKNAWAKKDADGSYWLFIEGDGLQAMFCLWRPEVNPITEQEVDEGDSISRRALDAWLAAQDRTNGKS